MFCTRAKQRRQNGRWSCLNWKFVQGVEGEMFSNTKQETLIAGLLQKCFLAEIDQIKYSPNSKGPKIKQEGNFLSDRPRRAIFGQVV